MTELARVTKKLAKMDQQRTAQMRERDRLIREARDAGNSWVSIQEASNLSPHAIALSLERTAQ